MENHVPGNSTIAPFLKWVGGKRQIMPLILERIPQKYSTYCEPFLGAGAVLFELQPEKAIINDFNGELINTYRVIKTNVNTLIEDLKKHRNDPDYFYQVRSKDRSAAFEQLTDVERASRIIYLNKTCYNGLYRVNNTGQYNTPFGKYKNPNIVNEAVLKAVSRYLNGCKIKITNGDYAAVLRNIPGDSFVYLDPPYHPLSSSANFTGYVKGGWGEDQQTRLKHVCDRLTAKKIKFLLSNSATAFIKNLYKDYTIDIITANRAVNSDSSKRGAVEEFLIRNY